MTFLTLSIIFLVGVLVVLWLNPPQITIRVDLSQAIPSNLNLAVQHSYKLPQKGEQGFEEPIPANVIEYCDLESDPWAREARKRRARQLKEETGSWDEAFKLLQREDAVLNE